jgi:nicotinamide-nucleotide adenylyltransferase
MGAANAKILRKKHAWAGKFVPFSPRNLARYPRLDTLVMVEEELFRHKSDKTITEIWRLLPKKVMWSTYITILDYLEYSGKIHVEGDKTVSWLWNPEEVRRLLANPKLVINTKKPVALFIGRFQPFHIGHLSAVKWIAARSAKVIVAIGSAQKSFEPENPFSASERARMIRAQLAAAGLGKRCTVVPVTDINDNERWVGHVDAAVPVYDIVYSNNLLVKRLMKEKGKQVKAIPFFKRALYDATKIRGKMRKGEKWQDRVPKKVLLLLKRMKAEERVRKL